MKPAPAPQESARLFRSQVEFPTLQPSVGGQNHDECKRDDEQEKESADKPTQTPVKPPRNESRKRADRGERRLHHGTSFVAGSPLRYREFDTTGESRGLLNKIDVQGSAGKNA
jgi:hypothetical protein